eukprot:Skav219394  [mRNA]  locus=scaffold2133:237665:249093:+ [translate_table: standard]
MDQPFEGAALLSTERNAKPLVDFEPGRGCFPTGQLKSSGVPKATTSMPTAKSSMEVSCVTMAKGQLNGEVRIAGTTGAARKAGAYALQQRLKRDFHSSLCNGMVCVNAHHGQVLEVTRSGRQLSIFAQPVPLLCHIPVPPVPPCHALHAEGQEGGQELQEGRLGQETWPVGVEISLITGKPKIIRQDRGREAAIKATKMTRAQWLKYQTDAYNKAWPKPEYMKEKRETVYVRDGGDGAYRQQTYEIVTRWTAKTKIEYRPHAKAPGSKSHIRVEQLRGNP